MSGASRPDRTASRRLAPALDLDALLQERFGIPSFRPWQREAIDALLGEDRRVLLVAPTGGGKSLCYQLPAVALDGTALVLSPLISLMEDQVRALESRGVPATFFASTLPREEITRRFSALRRGAYKLVYAAPERLAFDGFLEALQASRLSLVAIDEAHCIVQWGHDFRPEYLRIGDALRRLAPSRVLACTATATREARDEIIRRLGWSVPGAEDAPSDLAGPSSQASPATARDAPRIILRGFARPNLHLEVRGVDGPRDAARWTARTLTSALGRPRTPKGAGIVYAATRKGTEKLATALRADGWNAEAYHAGLPPEVRARISTAFADRELHLVVATNAFGMGIDRADVRVVVHAQPPSSIEAYYQEVGRAGRDGLPASGVLLFSPADIALRRRMCQLGPDGGEASPLDAARAWQLFRELLRYVDAWTCRHDFILRYFGDEAESLGGCGHCDVCEALVASTTADPEALERDNDIVRRALAGVARVKGAAGMQLIGSMLVGESNERLRRIGLDKLSTFGVLPARTHAEAMMVLRVLLANGWIDLTDSEYPVPLITPAGWRVMRAEVPTRVRLPLGLSRRAIRPRVARAERRAEVALVADARHPLHPAQPEPAPRRRKRRTSTNDAPDDTLEAPDDALDTLDDADATPNPPDEPRSKAPSKASHRAPASSALQRSSGERTVERLQENTDDALEERDQPLYAALREHRAELARARKVPPYVIAPDKTLRDVARIRPTSTDDLALARGMGPSRIAQYGEAVLSIVKAFSGR
ncbi:ATP-dependent DNA helicase RecQ [Chondromyces crocatus]|uniref:ATP-dependent DNA helicase RecQ n=1 Tax=Chondromyces crocatus TaxID=52 RepID=A0A0K1EM29_CHOCO|nr:ATP-dependent DNA helicase RecQ [Chondromyces crocatus]